MSAVNCKTLVCKSEVKRGSAIPRFEDWTKSTSCPKSKQFDQTWLAYSVKYCKIRCAVWTRPVETSASLPLRSNHRARPCGGIRNLGGRTTPSSANSGAVRPGCLRSPSLQGPFREGRMSRILRARRAHLHDELYNK